jgi:hypothetical protein
MHTGRSRIIVYSRAIGLQILSNAPSPESLSGYPSQLFGLFISLFGELHTDVASFVNDIRPCHGVEFHFTPRILVSMHPSLALAPVWMAHEVLGP